MMKKQSTATARPPSAPRSVRRQRKPPRYSTCAALLKHVGTWVGDDAQELRPGLSAWKAKKGEARRTKKAGPGEPRPGRPGAGVPTSKSEQPRRARKAETAPGFSTAGSLLKYAGTCVGNDLKRCLQELHATRSRLEI